VGYGPWVEEVWTNYLSNAILYGGRPDLTPSLPPHVEAGGVVQPDGLVRFWVRDNGRGLAPEDMQQLFVAFNRPGQKPLLGHGLGLAIVRHIVERLGGQVSAVSTLGEGSTFFFTLPGLDPDHSQGVFDASASA
jgi:signal transduction histidine kinase